jgi:spoIIIJ-associated protein
MKKQKKEIEIEGKTIEEAIQKGLEKLNLTREQVEIKILSEGSAGLFGLMGSKPAKIKIIERDGSVSKESSSIESFLKTETEKLLKLMNFRNYKLQITKFDDKFKIDINPDSNRDISLLIGRNGKTLSALETVIQTIVNTNIPKLFPNLKENKPKINVDVNHYNERQIEKIMSEVDKIVSIVKRTGKIYKLKPMPARIRRLIHIKLKNDPEIESVSEGETDQRCIVIKLKK